MKLVIKIIKINKMKAHFPKKLLFVVYNLIFFSFLYAQDSSDWQENIPDGCTSVTAGRLATADGSVVTSHTDDSHRTRSWINIIPMKKYHSGETAPVYKRIPYDSLAMPVYKHIKIGEIPQVNVTFGYINTAYPCMNQYQVGIGESTFGGREELQSDSGLIDCQGLCRLILERSKSAREAIILAGELTGKYGWRDYGECLTISDKNEVWHLEILGPGKGKVGSVWAAQRVPDDHISVNANASRIMEIDLFNPDFYLASDNVYAVAKTHGWWNETQGPFRFCYAYAPESRTSFASRRREWRVLDLAAPSLNLDPNAENYPFSVKPDQPITLEFLVRIFKDYFEGTEFNFVKNITVTNDSGKTVISPFANPFMPYDMNKVFNINGGWGWRGERTIARWYTMYATIIQSRNWLPDEIGGVTWLAMDNVATSIYIPVYCSVTDLPEPYKTPGRPNGYTTESAWWAFNRLGTLTAQRWGDMKHDVEAVWKPWQTELFRNQKQIEKEALNLYKPDNPDKTIRFLTDYTNDWGYKVVKKAWELGDFLWTKYDELF
jgi:dipeptidase